MEIARLILEYLDVLAWPAVTAVALLAFRKPLVAILHRIKTIALPGDVALDFDQGVRDAKHISGEIEQSAAAEPDQPTPTLPLTEANTRMIALGLQPSPSGLDFRKYKHLAHQDPNLALAGLRMELELLGRNLLKGFGLENGDHRTLGTILRQLRDHEAITQDQYRLLLNILKLTNAAIHGRRVSQDDANDVIDAAQVLTHDYLQWLSWGFGDGWKPRATRNAPLKHPPATSAAGGADS